MDTYLHVGEGLLNRATGGSVRVRCRVFASVRDARYDVKCVVDGKSSVGLGWIFNR